MYQLDVLLEENYLDSRQFVYLCVFVCVCVCVFLFLFFCVCARFLICELSVSIIKESSSNFASKIERI